MKHCSIIVAAFAVLTATFGCGEQQTATTDAPVATDSIVVPDSEVRGATIYLYTRGKVTSEIHAERIYQYDPADSTVGFVLDIRFYDDHGQQTSNLIGDSGIIREEQGLLQVYGHVVAHSGTRTLETDSLIWDKATDKIRTDAFVKIVEPKRVLSGWGLEAESDLSRYRILRGISGRATDIKEIADSL